ncbi:GDP dissociation inhibitor [Gilbertella persicaria]|uniref:GDP dissociation inhibitor n=1 Tax=Gilbertella persicaria TaxID=101096 RepID=UPI0022200DCA|nr:GDP dissociation inhibitor [Gilbertella persicaria]KAI8061549.1 GDP dissociation inhibitor [Gilbertella persicaria]
MEENLENEHFDYIVLGTGLIESILAGSLSRSGKKVLHLDSHQNYGGNWVVFGFRELVQWCLDQAQETTRPCIEENKIDYENSYASNFRHVELHIHAEQPVEDETMSLQPSSSSDQSLFDAFFKDQPNNIGKKQLFIDLLKHSRLYNLDSTPKLLGSREDLVEALVRSGVGRYLEFKNVDDIYIFDKAKKALEKVPSSKEDVFTNKSVTLVEKRKLMKFLTFAMESNEQDPLLEGTEQMSFAQFLQDKFKMSDKLQEAIVYAIALVDQIASVKVGLQTTQAFVKAMGRFGKGAYLCPLYGGASEIAQAFCRMCAVYGGIYMLNQPLDHYLMEEGKCVGVTTTDGKQFKCDKLIADIDYLSPSWLPQEQALGTWISRAMIVTSKDVPTSIGYSVFPPGVCGNSEPIYGIHQNEESMACQKGQYVTYLWTTSKEPFVLKEAADLLTKDTIFTVFYEQYVRNAPEMTELPANVIPCSDPDVTLDFQSAVTEAKSLFYQCVDTSVEFMPAAEEQEDDDIL